MSRDVLLATLLGLRSAIASRRPVGELLAIVEAAIQLASPSKGALRQRKLDAKKRAAKAASKASDSDVRSDASSGVRNPSALASAPEVRPPQTPRSGEDLSLNSSSSQEKEEEEREDPDPRARVEGGEKSDAESDAQKKQRTTVLLAAFERIVHGGKLSAGDDAPALAVLAGLLPVLDARAETPAAALALFEAVLVAYATHKHERGLGVVLAFFCADFATWADRPGLATPRRTMSEPAAPLDEPEPEACPPELVAQLARMRNRTRCA
jgi:hypothetical protein